MPMTDLSQSVCRPFSIRCWLGRYGNNWVVIRERDGKVMTESASVRECCRWVRTWGPSRV
jgi:hypothetical protein